MIIKAVIILSMLVIFESCKTTVPIHSETSPHDSPQYKVKKVGEQERADPQNDPLTTTEEELNEVMETLRGVMTSSPKFLDYSTICDNWKWQTRHPLPFGRSKHACRLKIAPHVVLNMSCFPKDVDDELAELKKLQKVGIHTSLVSKKIDFLKWPSNRLIINTCDEYGGSKKMVGYLEPWYPQEQFREWGDYLYLHTFIAQFKNNEAAKRRFCTDLKTILTALTMREAWDDSQGFMSLKTGAIIVRDPRSLPPDEKNKASSEANRQIAKYFIEDNSPCKFEETSSDEDQQ